MNQAKTTMKHVTSYWKSVVGAGVLLAVIALASAGAAEDKNAQPKPYPLKTCIVSGETLGGDMGKPYVFTYQGQEIKLCCKDCLKKFNKEPAKFIKKIEEASVQHGAHKGHAGHQH